MENNENKKHISDSRKRANKKYKDANYKKLCIETKIEDIEKIKAYSKTIGLTQVDFIVRACNYFIDNKETPPE